MKSLWAYRNSIIFNLIISIIIYYGSQHLLLNNNINLDVGLIKEISLTLVGFFGTLIGFFITIVSVLASSNSKILEKLREISHFRNLVAITLFVSFSMLLFCIGIITMLVLGYGKTILYASLFFAGFYFPIGMMVRLFYIYYLLLSR